MILAKIYMTSYSSNLQMCEILDIRWFTIVPVPLRTSVNNKLKSSGTYNNKTNKTIVQKQLKMLQGIAS